MNHSDTSLALLQTTRLSTTQKIYAVLGGAGLTIMLFCWAAQRAAMPHLLLPLSLLLIAVGTQLVVDAIQDLMAM